MLTLEPAERLVFHHLPKTAGTSIHNELTGLFLAAEICPERGPALARFTSKELLSYKFFSGHYDKYNVDLVPGPKTVFTFLREPKSRIVSLYYYWRSHKWEFINAANMSYLNYAKSLSLLDFLNCEDRTVLFFIDNSLSRSYSGRGEHVKCCGAEDEYFADWAFQNLQRYNFVGFMETFDEDVARMRSLLGIEKHMDIPKHNQRGIISSDEQISREHPGEVERVTSEIEERLHELTSIDSLFYNKARAVRLRLGCPYPW